MLREVSDFTAVLGEWNRMDDDDGQCQVDIQRLTVAPEYNRCLDGNLSSHDVALLETSQSMEWVLTRNGLGSVNRICLGGQNEEPETGELLTVSGWGYTYDPDATVSDVLRAVRIPVAPFEECRDGYAKLTQPMTIDDGQICVGPMNGGRGPCHGDSGGPLVQFKDGRAWLVGLVTGGSSCTSPGLPGVYLKVSHKIDWIHEHL